MRLETICEHTFLARLDDKSVVVDFGANRGEFAHAIIERYGCAVFSAEPVPELAGTITAHPRLALFPVAVSGACGSMDINVFPGRCASGFRRHDGEAAVKTIRAETVTLAEFRRRAGVGRIDLLKIDIEGAELDMFAAADDGELDDVDQITVEFHDFLYPETRPAVERVKDRLRAMGFRMVAFSGDNSDVLFVNRRASVSALYLLWARTVIRYTRGLQRRLLRTIRRLRA